MLKVEQISYKKTGHQRLFYVAQNKIQRSIIAHVYTSAEGRKDVEFSHLEFELWDVDFVFKYPGKYSFIIFEDGLKTLILIVTIG